MTSLCSWVQVTPHSDFPIQNIPFGVFKTASSEARLATRIGDKVLDLAACAKIGIFDDIVSQKDVFSQKYLNDFIALGKKTTALVRNKLIEILAEGSIFEDKIKNFLYNISEVEMLMPVKIGDYTDFYSSIEHATNVGKMFRDPANALLPNWKHLPVAYHGRASSIMVSGTPVRRPKGQLKATDAVLPTFEASKNLDFELEMAFVIGKENALGESISTAQAEEHIFGFLIFNDWSARDIQKWEYVPLGPFLSKNFISSLSAWVVTLEALDDFRVESPVQEPTVLSYLQYEGKRNFDIYLEVYIQPQNSEATKVCSSNFKHLYWNICQQLAHHTVGGCNMQIGDLCASGTISGSESDSYGSLLELTWQGTKPLKMADGTERKFLQDYDTVIIKAFAQKGDLRIGFGEVIGQIIPA